MSRIIVQASILSLSLFWYFIGYQKAHHEVATECERLGGFYVGEKTYTCTVAKKEEQVDDQQ